MALTFYPHTDELIIGTLDERIGTLMEAAERYKAVILDEAAKAVNTPRDPAKRSVPRELIAAYNWEEIATLLKEIRDLPEIDKNDKLTKGRLLAKLAEIYEVLRAAKMPKLEAVRLALVNESKQMQTNAAQGG